MPDPAHDAALLDEVVSLEADTSADGEGVPEADGGAAPEPALAESEARIAQLERSLEELRQELSQREEALRQAQAVAQEQQAEAEGLRGQVSQALGSLRDSLLAANPDVLAELVQGGSVQELEASLRRARELVERVRAQVENRMAQERIPPGTPPRSTPNLSALSPRDKIAYALSRPAR